MYVSIKKSDAMAVSILSMLGALSGVVSMPSPVSCTENPQFCDQSADIFDDGAVSLLQINAKPTISSRNNSLHRMSVGPQLNASVLTYRSKVTAPLNLTDVAGATFNMIPRPNRSQSAFTNASTFEDFSLYSKWQGLWNLKLEERGIGLLMLLVIIVITLLALLGLCHDDASTTDVANRKKQLARMNSQLDVQRASLRSAESGEANGGIMSAAGTESTGQEAQ